MIWLTARQGGILALALVVALAGFFSGHLAIMALGLFFSILWWVSAWLARRTLSDLQVMSRLADETAEIGQVVRAEMRVLNPLPWPILDVAWKLALPRDLEANGGHTLSGNLWVGARQRVRIHMELRPESRGRYRIGPGSLTFKDPLSWNELIREDQEVTYLTVFPRRYPVPAALNSVFSDVGAYHGRPWDQPDPLRVIGVRPYQPGDSLRRLSAHASARFRQPMVKEWEPVQERALEIILHPKTTDHHWQGVDRQVLEDSVSMAAGAVEGAIREGIPLGLSGSGALPGHIHGFRLANQTRTDLASLLTALAWVQPSGTMDEDLVRVAHHILSPHKPLAMVVIVSPYWPEPLTPLLERRRGRRMSLVHLSAGPRIPKTPEGVRHWHWQEGAWHHV